MATQITLSTPTTREAAPQAALRPLGLAGSLAFFGVPALATFTAFYALIPFLRARGYDDLTSYLAGLCVPLALMFAAALVTYHKVEGRPLTWQAFAERMRYPRLRWRDVLWGCAAFLGAGVGMALLGGLVALLIRNGWMPVPAHLPAMADPRVPFSLEMLVRSAGGVIRGRWDIAAVYGVTFFFNIFGEELWWRGIILPRQELAFGRRTWLVHGLMWACFHVFKWWDILPLAPGCLLVALIAQRTRSNWGALIGHILMNGLSLAVVLWAIAG